MKLSKLSKIRYLSNNFAGKEALSKVLGLGFSEGVSLKEIEILRNPKGKPYINLLGKTKIIAKDLDIKNTVIIKDGNRDLKKSEAVILMLDKINFKNKKEL